MHVPADRRYSTDHEWAKPDGNRLRVGITDYAQDALGDVVYVDIPEVGTAVIAGQPFGEVESTKSVSDVYSPVTGTVTERNEGLGDEPETVNDEPYGDGWMVVIELSDPSELGALLSAEAYKAFTEEESGDEG